MGNLQGVYWKRGKPPAGMPRSTGMETAYLPWPYLVYG